MFVALDKNGNRVSIDSAEDGKEYFCDICKEKLIIKRGDVKAHHFAHTSGTRCKDNWHYDMSEWHKWWQNLFPIENQEVVMSDGEAYHRADVFINKTVIEFQHSPLSPGEFNERNNFYTRLGYKVVWIFDVRDVFDEERISEIEGKNYVFKWDHPFHTLDYYDPDNDRDIIVYLHFADEELDEDKKQHPYLLKITWISPDGIRRFATKKKEYREFEIEEFKEIVKIPVSDHIYNDMFRDHQKPSHNHGYLFEGCPISSSGLATTDVDYNGDKYGKCRECKHCFDYFKCKYPEDILDLPKDAKIIEIKRDALKFVIEVLYSGEDGIIQSKTIPQFNHNCGDIVGLWDRMKVEKVAIYRDISNDTFVMINKDPKSQILKYGKIYGRISKDQYNFPSQSKEIYYFKEKRWTIVWQK